MADFEPEYRLHVFVHAAFDYHGPMWDSLKEIRTVQQRLALLKQQERELRILFSQSHASLSDTEEIETKLLALAAEIAELESDQNCG